MHTSRRLRPWLAAVVVVLITPRAHAAVRAAVRAAGDLNAHAEQIARAQLQQFGKNYSARIDRRRHIVYISALDDAHLARTLNVLSAFTDAFRRTLPVERPAWNVTVVLPTAADYAALPKPFPDCIGFYSPAGRRLVSVDRGRTLLHEFTHALHHADAAAARQRHPIWVTEGLATLFEAATITPSGLVPRTDARLLTLRRALTKDGAFPLKDLLTMGRTAFMKDSALAYAEARYVMLYLHERGHLADWYRRYKAAFSRDPDGVRTLEAALGNRLFLIEPTWKKWVLSLRMPLTEGRAREGRLGLQVRNDPRGAKVTGMLPGSPARLAGRIRVGDIIQRFNGRTVSNAVELAAAVRSAGAMQTVRVELLRHGRKLTVLQPLGAPDGH